MQKARKLLPALLVTLTVVLLFGSPRLAAGQSRLDRDSVSEFADSYFENALRLSGAPGAVVAVVQGDEVILLRGYGVSDIETGRPTDPRRTAYRLGSITKPLTAIAVLQLAEEGRFDLDDFVRPLLGSLAFPGSETLTVRQLLTHRGGLDSDPTGSLTTKGTADVDLEATRRRLQRVQSPGVPAYDILGFGVLGLLVSQMDGLSFADALERRIFDPLGMTRTFAGLGRSQAAEVARCHISEGPGTARICPEQQLVPAFQGSGSVASTAQDMTRLMRALLGGGELDGQRILSRSAFDRFTDFEQFRFHPRAMGLGLGIRELARGGRLAFGHGGGISGFSNQMDLFPAEGVGVYVGINGGPEQIYEARLSRIPALLEQQRIDPQVAEAISSMERFGAALADELLPKPGSPPELAELDPEDIDAHEVAGFYVFNRFKSNNLLVNLTALGIALEVEELSSNELVIQGMGDYTADGGSVFRAQQGTSWFVFRSRDGRAWISFRGDPYSIYERRSTLESPLFVIQLPLISLALLPLLGALGLRRIRILPGSAALCAIAGTVALLGCLALELELATVLLEVENRPTPVILWRGLAILSLLTIGVAPYYAWTRHGLGRRSPVSRLGALVARLTLTAASISVVAPAAYWIVVTYF